MKEKKKRGRHEYEPKLGEREKVELLVSCGFKPKEIALVIGISVPTLKKVFFQELNEGPLKKKAEVLGYLHQQSKKNSAAAKQLLEKMEAEPLPAIPPSSDSEKAKEPKLGKKDAAQREAEVAHKNSEWGTLLKPENSLPN